jgi:hypothetical protein
MQAFSDRPSLRMFHRLCSPGVTFIGKVQNWRPIAVWCRPRRSQRAYVAVWSGSCIESREDQSTPTVPVTRQRQYGPVETRSQQAVMVSTAVMLPNSLRGRLGPAALIFTGMVIIFWSLHRGLSPGGPGGDGVSASIQNAIHAEEMQQLRDELRQTQELLAKSQRPVTVVPAADSPCQAPLPCPACSPCIGTTQVAARTGNPPAWA